MVVSLPKTTTPSSGPRLTTSLLSFLESLLHVRRHQFVNNELIVKTGLVDKRKVGWSATPTVFVSHRFLYIPTCSVFFFNILFIFFTQGLFAKRRQLILTDAPRLYYVDPAAMELKGEIPWSVC